MIHNVQKGIGTGAALGALGGMLVFAIAAPGLGIVGAGGIAAMGAAGGFGGAMLGGYTGVAASNEEFEEHQRLAGTRLQPGEVLVVACGHNHRQLVEDIFARHGGRLVTPDESSDQVE